MPRIIRGGYSYLVTPDVVDRIKKNVKERKKARERERRRNRKRKNKKSGLKRRYSI